MTNIRHSSEWQDKHTQWCPHTSVFCLTDYACEISPPTSFLQPPSHHGHRMLVPTPTPAHTARQEVGYPRSLVSPAHDFHRSGGEGSVLCCLSSWYTTDLDVPNERLWWYQGQIYVNVAVSLLLTRGCYKYAPSSPPRLSHKKIRALTRYLNTT